MEEKKESKLAKKIKAKLLKILVVILAVVLVAGAFYAIANAIIGYIKELVAEIISALVNFFRDLGAEIKGAWGNFTNNLNALLDKEEFDPTSYENLRTDPVIVIDNETVEEALANIDKQIDRDSAGLDNIMTKKMLLAYYRGLYLDDTKILIEITQNDLQMTGEEWLGLFRTDKGMTEEEESILDTWDNMPSTPNDMGFDAVGVLQAMGEIIKYLDELCGEKTNYYLSQKGKTYLKENHGSSIFPFEVVEGDPNNLTGSVDGSIYLQTTGMLQVFVDGTDTDKCDGCTPEDNRENCKYTKKDTYDENGKLKVCYYKIKYYSNTPAEDGEEAPLTELYNHYLECFRDKGGVDTSGYTKAVKDYLTTCYTHAYVENVETGELEYAGVKMYSQRETIATQKTWEYLNETKEANPSSDFGKWLQETFADGHQTIARNLIIPGQFPVVAQTIEFQSKVSPYVNSVEFMVDLMEITGSKDFINAFIQTVGEENYVQMRLYTLQSEETEQEVELKTRTTTVNGEINYTAKVVSKNKKGFDWEGWNSDGVDGIAVNVTKESNTSIKVEIPNSTNMMYKVALYANGKDTTKRVYLYMDDLDLFYDANNSSKTVTNLKPVSYNFIDVSDIEERTVTETITLKYDIGISKIKTWYGEKSFVNNIDGGKNIDSDLVITIEHHETEKDEDRKPNYR